MWVESRENEIILSWLSMLEVLSLAPRGFSPGFGIRAEIPVRVVPKYGEGIKDGGNLGPSVLFTDVNNHL